MSSTVWGKFYWTDYASDEALKMCSLSAQGLWMRMLCTMAGSEPYGYLTINGHTLNNADLAKLYAVGNAEVDDAVAELNRYGVFSRDANQRIYSRRMVRDFKKAAIAKKNGKRGGNPSLNKQRDIQPLDNHQDKGADKPHIPESRIQKPDKIEERERARATRLPPDWTLTDELFSFATELGMTHDQITTELCKFRDYWVGVGGARGRKADWSATWRNWIRRACEDRKPKRGNVSNFHENLTSLARSGGY